jgi:hypothetical protein
MTIDEAIYALDQDLGKREGAQVFASLAIYLELNKRGRLRIVAETALFRRHGTNIPYDESWWLDGKNLVSVVPSLSDDDYTISSL